MEIHRSRERHTPPERGFNYSDISCKGHLYYTTGKVLPILLTMRINKDQKIQGFTRCNNTVRYIHRGQDQDLARNNRYVGGRLMAHQLQI